MMEQVSDDLEVDINAMNTDDHVPEAECNNQTIKERSQITYYRLPYKGIPQLMIRYLGMISADQLNYFPAKGGISDHFISRMIMQQRTYHIGSTVKFHLERMCKLTMSLTQAIRMNHMP